MNNHISQYGKLLRVDGAWVPEPHPNWVFQEKLDGNQISFGLPLDAPDGPAIIRSKSTDARTNGAFAQACASIDQMKLTPGYVYRGEFISKPKMNKLAYNRAPKGFIVLFDVQCQAGYFVPDAIKTIAAELGCEAAPVMGTTPHPDWLKAESLLGGSIEGWVGKNYALRDKWGHAVRVKRVRDDLDVTPETA